MPTLDRLQATLGGSDFEVVALSIDRAGIGAVDAFYADIGVENLARYIDESGRTAQQLSALRLPTTLLPDRDGREIARRPEERRGGKGCVRTGRCRWLPLQ